ncbi:LuxR family two component transcriptional regulator [Halanaerobium saccharolyticum]|uniref:Stage 0 sporulation protein A homolog n=1 Tax=Halanaerobium saccharolyticum TaxID=43595 RepID=A0A4R6M248_9FIRM|nr:response regulator transcription factor [Halanaerobium saccharolyticum]TDO95273.1 LuxR family two component transcriptional regulator [Halanaerobium saccharolyticum]
MKVLIADDHPLFIEGLTNLLKAEDFIEIVAVAHNGKEVVELALAQKPDVILMDISMPILNGIEATKEIKNRLPECKILILTSFEEEDSLFTAIKAGASGYLLKSLNGDELLNSLSDINEGKNPFSAGLEEQLLEQLQKNMMMQEERDLLFRKLSERQLEVVKYLSKGLTYNEIGDKLYLSERTIKYHIEQIKEKLNIKTQSQIISLADKY